MAGRATPAPRLPNDPGGCGPASSYRPPLWASGSSTLATSGAAFSAGTQWGDYNGHLFVSTLKERDVRRFSIDAPGTTLGGPAAALRRDLGPPAGDGPGPGRAALRHDVDGVERPRDPHQPGGAGRQPRPGLGSLCDRGGAQRIGLPIRRNHRLRRDRRRLPRCARRQCHGRPPRRTRPAGAGIVDPGGHARRAGPPEPGHDRGPRRTERRVGVRARGPQAVCLERQRPASLGRGPVRDGGGGERRLLRARGERRLHRHRPGVRRRARRGASRCAP